MKIEDKLKNARLSKAYNQEDIADKLGVTRQTISNWENGKSLPDIISIIKLSDLYELSLDEMIKGDEKLMNKIEKDVMNKVAEKKLVRFAWISIVLGTILIILSELFEGNPFIDFISGALPWLLLGFLLIFALLYLNKEDEQ